MRASQAKVNARADSLEELQRLASLGTVAGVIAHELNNLLTPVISYAELALEHPSDADLQRTAIRRIAEAAQRAGTVSKAVLEFSHAGASRHGAIADVRACVDQVLLLLCRQPERKRIHVHTTFHAEQCLASIRPIALQQVLLNLYLNAQQAMPQGGTVRIRTSGTASRPAAPSGARAGSAVSCDGPWVVIVFEDTGPGIDVALLREIWTAGRSERADGTMGAGLGLKTCRALIEQAGGGIWVESEPGGGARFTIVLGAANVEA